MPCYKCKESSGALAQKLCVKPFCGLCVDIFVPRKKRKDKNTQNTQRQEQKCHSRIVATALFAGA